MSTAATNMHGIARNCIVSNNGQILNDGGAAGDLVGVNPIKSPGSQSQVWRLEDAPAEAKTKFPGKQCHVLCTVTDTPLFLASGKTFGPGPIGDHRIHMPFTAVTNADKANAWWFVFEGSFSHGTTYEGKIVSPDGVYTLALRGDNDTPGSPDGTAYMSPDSNVSGTNWKVEMLIMDSAEEK